MYTSINLSAAEPGFTYQGRIVGPDGLPLKAAAVEFRVELHGPATLPKPCLMFSEKFTVNMSSGDGGFSMIIGRGERTDLSTFPLAKIFSSALIYPVLPQCENGYVKQVGDQLYLKVSFNDGSGAQTLAPLEITTTPYSMDTVNVAGLPSTQVLRVDSAVAAAPLSLSSYALNLTNFTDLVELLNGTSNKYLKSTALTLPATAGTSGQVLTVNGSGGTSWTTPSSGGITGINVSPPLVVATEGTLRTIGINAANSTTQGVLTAADWNTFNNKVSSQWTSNASNISYSSGYVGIGTTTPTRKLDVNGDLNVATTIYLNGGTVVDANRRLFAANGTDYLPGILFGNSSQDSGIFLPADHMLGLSAGGAERIRIDASGNVGIGTTSPAAKLEIDGTSGATLKIVDGNQAANKVLTSDANGQASWQAASGGFAGTVNITSTPYTITNAQNGYYFTYSNAAAGIINLPAISGLSDGFQVTVVRDVAQSVTLTPNGADSFPSGITTLEMQGNNYQSATLTKLGSKWRLTNKTDDCIVGQSCWGTNNIYIGVYNGHQYFTTPGNCVAGTPYTCNGATDTVTKAWANNSGTTAYGVTTGASNNIDGKSQTATLATSYTDTDAAKFCNNINSSGGYGGYSDWYLPARQELSFLYQQSANVPGFVSSSYYWSSTEGSTTNAWYFTFIYGYFINNAKTGAFYVRCVRRF